MCKVVKQIIGLFYILLFNHSHFGVKNAFAQKYLTRNGTNLMLNGEKVFLSGMNQAWFRYGGDFGNTSYEISKPHLMNTMDIMKASGGNSIRMWVHATGSNTPSFNVTGHVIGPGLNTTRDLLDFVREAQKRNILVTFSLWNAAAMKPGDHVYDLLYDDSILQSYITNALIPMVRALKQEKAMAIWEIINEPEGSMQMEKEDRSDPCFDTSTIHVWDFADWTKNSIPLKNFLRFIGLQASAIHHEDPKALVTVGSWTYKSVTDALDRRNFYSDTCLKLASDGQSGAKLDLYQIHTYDTLHFYLPHDPFRVDARVYNLDKPAIIGEFSQKRGGFMTSPEQFTWAYNHGYNGAWSWSAIDSDDASDTVAVQETGLRSLKDKNDQSKGGRVNINLQEAHVTKNLLQFIFGYMTWIMDLVLVF